MKTTKCWTNIDFHFLVFFKIWFNIGTSFAIFDTLVCFLELACKHLANEAQKMALWRKRKKKKILHENEFFTFKLCTVHDKNMDIFIYIFITPPECVSRFNELYEYWVQVQKKYKFQLHKFITSISFCIYKIDSFPILVGIKEKA